MMRKVVIVAAAVGLAALGGCNNRSPEGAAIENQGEIISDQLENAADDYRAAGGNATDPKVRDAFENEADHVEQVAANTRDAAKTSADQADDAAGR